MPDEITPRNSEGRHAAYGKTGETDYDAILAGDEPPYWTPEPPSPTVPVPRWKPAPVGPAPPLTPMFCRHCGKHLRAEQGAYAATNPNDGAPWYCILDPRDGKTHQP